MDNDDLRDEGDRLIAESGLAMTGLLGATTSLHEIYVTLLQSGFNKMEALWVVGYVLVGGSRSLDTTEEMNGQ